MATALSDVARYSIIRRQRIAETAPVRVVCARCGFSFTSEALTSDAALQAPPRVVDVGHVRQCLGRCDTG